MALKPRIDKTDPKVGSFRAALNADWTDADINKVWAVGLNSSGLVVKGPGTSGIVGIVIRTKKGEKAGDTIDVHTAGEVFPFVETDGTAVVAGTKYYGHSDGTVDDVATAGVLVGFATSDGRLIMRNPNGADKISIGQILTTGTADATTYLRGDGAWTVNAP